MEFSHYGDVMIREAAIANELHARLLLVIHQQNQTGVVVAAAWPDWRPTPGEFGLLFRVFGTPSDVDAYFSRIRPLSDAGLVRAYPVQTVPEDAYRKPVIYTRDRGHDNVSPAAARRMVKRAAARGQAWQPPADSARRGGDHFLVIPSGSSGEIFRLYVKRTTRTEGGNAGNGYGLGWALPDF